MLLSQQPSACAGLGEEGELGNGGTDTSAVPVEVSGNHTFMAISPTGIHTCGVAVRSGEEKLPVEQV